MRRILLSACVVLPFALGGPLAAQGTKGPSGSGAESAAKQSRSHERADKDDPRVRDTREREQPPKDSTKTADPGDADSRSSVAPTAPATPYTTGPEKGANRSSSGGVAGPRPGGMEGQDVQ